MTGDHDERPWGSYTVLVETDDYKVKQITVAPAQRLSYQRHARRGEHWYVVRGVGRVTLADNSFDVGPGSAVDVPVGTAHRIANSQTTTPLTFIEIQRGDYLGEDDIVRLEDDYGRGRASAAPGGSHVLGR